jgi:PPP family 3-phenylpropionic acid transporter
MLYLFIGGMGNYFTIWLRDVGFEDSDIGWQGSIRFFCLCLAPLFWGHLADKSGQSRRVIRIIALLSAVFFVPFLATHEVAVLLIATLFFAFIRTGIIATSDAFALTHIERSGDEYGRIRVFGSMGFIVGGFAMAGFVTLLDRQVVPYVLEVALVLTALVALGLPDYRLEPQAQGSLKDALKRLLGNPRLKRFYFIAFMSRLSSQGLYIFLPLHLKDLNVSDSILPIYWTVGVVSEIVLIRTAPKLFSRYRAHRVIALTFLMAAIQYVLISVITNPLWLLPVMLLHGMAFGIWYYYCVLWLGKAVGAEDRSRAQGLFAAVGFGLGGTTSSALAGYLYSAGKGPHLFAVAAVGIFITMVLAFWLLQAPGEPSDSVSSD